MPRKSTSESQESRWQASAAGRKATQTEFERALRSGSLSRSGGAGIPATGAEVLNALMEKAKARATQAISIRVPVADLERARKIAARKGIGYQTVLKQAIRAGLR